MTVHLNFAEGKERARENVVCPIYVINLPHRTDRLEKIKKIFKDFNIIVVEAVKHDDPVIGCFLSHKKCIQIAKEKNLKYITVIEDDCIPFDGIEIFKEKYFNIKKYLETVDNWYVFLGGTIETKRRHIINKINDVDINLYNISIGYCAHFIIYNHKTYEHYLNHKMDKPLDHVWNEIAPALISLPFIASQDDTYSDITKSNYSYNKRIRETNDRLIKYVKKL